MNSEQQQELCRARP